MDSFEYNKYFLKVKRITKKWKNMLQNILKKWEKNLEKIMKLLNIKSINSISRKI